MARWLAGADIWFEKRLSWLADRPRWAAAFLIALCIALYLPGMASLPVTDRDEGRFTQATKQMLESGDFIDIRFQDEPRYKKPIGIHWLQSVSVALFSPHDLTQIWAYRIPSQLGIIVAVLLTWWAAGPIFGRRPALLAAALLAGAFTLAMESRIAKSDAVLLAAVVLAQGALARIYLLRRKRQDMVTIAAVFWIALGIGIMIKGPVAPALTLFTVLPLLFFDKDRGWLRNLHAAWGVPVMLTITLPWFIAIGVTSDWEFFRLAVGEDFLAKLHRGMENHWGPPGYYFALFWWSFWPATIIATGGVAIWMWQQRRRRRVLFLLSWIIPFWLVLEATPTKLPHYAMAIYPAIAMGSAWVLMQVTLSGGVPMRTYKQAAALWLFIALLVLVFFAFLLVYFAVVPPLWAIPLVLCAAAMAIITFNAAWRGKFYAASASCLITAMLIYTAGYRFIMPEVEQLWLSHQTANVIAALRPCAQGPVVMTRYREPSAIFLLGTQTQFANAPTAFDRLLNGQARYGLFDAKEVEQGSLETAKLTPLACISGFNVNVGRHLEMQILSKEPAETFAGCPVPERYRCPG